MIFPFVSTSLYKQAHTNTPMHWDKCTCMDVCVCHVNTHRRLRFCKHEPDLSNVCCLQDTWKTCNIQHPACSKNMHNYWGLEVDSFHMTHWKHAALQFALARIKVSLIHWKHAALQCALARIKVAWIHWEHAAWQFALARIKVLNSLEKFNATVCVSVN